MKSPYCIKICTKCNRLLVANSMNFHTQMKGKYGVMSYCKECTKKYNSEHKEHQAEYCKQWRANNKQHIAEYRKQHYRDNKERYAEYDKKYYKNNKEHIAEYGKQWASNNRERKNEIGRKAQHKRRAKLKFNGGEYTLEQWQECLEFFNYTCAYSGEPINNSNTNIEHIIPISKGGSNNIYNIVPALDIVNKSKNASDMLEWYKEQPYYSEERLNKILDWIEYASNKYELNR